MTGTIVRCVLVALAVLAAVVPAALALALPSITPPRTSLAFALISLLAGALSLALLYYFRYRLTRSLRRPEKCVIFLALVALVAATAYLLLIDRVNIHAEAPDGTDYGYIFTPLWLRGDVKDAVKKEGSVQRVIERNGPRVFERALEQMPGIDGLRMATTLVLLATFVAAETGTAAALSIAVMQPQRVGEVGLGRPFRAALTFAGEFREVVEVVATTLRDSLGNDTVFYDKWYEAELAVPDLDRRLKVIYRDEAELLVVFLGRNYDKKQWTRLEWRAIFDAIILRQRDRRDVMLIRLDNTKLTNIASTDGYVDAQNLKPQEIAAMIKERLEARKL